VAVIRQASGYESERFVETIGRFEPPCFGRDPLYILNPLMSVLESDDIFDEAHECDLMRVGAQGLFEQPPRLGEAMRFRQSKRPLTAAAYIVRPLLRGYAISYTPELLFDSLVFRKLPQELLQKVAGITRQIRVELLLRRLHAGPDLRFPSAQ
jgi:hypothetical protein